jgi:cytochrome c-type biogenesis protein CcmF
MTGAFISHLGISFLLIGTLASGGYSESVPLRLEVGNHKDVLGYKFTLTGKEQIEKHLLDREKYVYNINVVKNGDTTTLKPVVYWSSFNDFQSPFFEPGIATFLFKDIYISPKSIEADPNSPKVIISKNDSAFVPYDSSISVKLLRYDMSRMNMSANTEHFTFGAVVLLTEKGISKEITLESVMNMASQQFSPQWQNIKGTNIQMGFTGFIPSEEIALSKAEITFVKEAFNADVTVKPFINLVWLGVAAIVAGFIISIFRRLPGKKKLPENITE